MQQVGLKFKVGRRRRQCRVAGAKRREYSQRGANFDASRVRQFEIKHLPCGTRATETSGNSQLTVAQACDRQTDRQTCTQRQTAVLHKDGLVAFSDIHPGTTWYSIGRQKEPRVFYTQCQNW